MPPRVARLAFEIALALPRPAQYNDNMTAAQQKLLEATLALPEDIRQQIGEALTDSVSSEAEIEQAWRAEAMTRAEDIGRGDVQPLQASAVFESIRAQLSPA